MGGRWTPKGFQLSRFMVFVVVLEIHCCFSLNSDGLALLKFRARVDSDPNGAFANWNPNDSTPCTWLGVHCVDTEVQILDLKELSLKGIMAPELGELIHLKSLILCKNHFYGTIPKEIGELTMLELLDLRGNGLYGTIPAEIGRMQSLKHLLLSDNKLKHSSPFEFQNSELGPDDYLTSVVATGIGCLNRKFGHWFNFGTSSLDDHGDESYNSVAISSNSQIIENLPSSTESVRRTLLQQQSSNLEAVPASSAEPLSGQLISLPTSRSSGAFPAVPNGKKRTDSVPTPAALAQKIIGNPNESRSPSNRTSAWTFFAVGAVLALLTIFIAMFLTFRSQGVTRLTTIGPWKTGLSGQLQKAFITGVPTLNRSELETACEDFSNIIDTLDDCIVYKGTLSSGVEIAVACAAIKSSKEWSKRSERAYRKKINTLSRINHKNFVNLLGFCEENEPFTRMMVFEYAPNGTLFEHLHVKDMEHLDWNSRTRIIMGVAYCLQYMHHDLNPPVSHPNLNSTSIYLTDDFAAKIGEISFSAEASSKTKRSSDDESSEHSELPPYSDPETNVYSFGILLLEIISGKLPFSEKQGSLLDWASQYLSDKRSISYMIDPSLKSFKDRELDIICEVIQECIQQDPRQRPTIKEIISKLREVIAVPPEVATPRLSPLWWAELEILSVEAT